MEKNNYVPFKSSFKKGPCQDVPSLAVIEWENNVKSPEKAMEWHLKWTPWFTPDIIKGLIKTYKF